MKSLNLTLLTTISLACLPVKKNAQLLSENSSELKSCFEKSELLYSEKYNTDHQYNLYESLSYYEENGKSYLITSSEKNHEVYKIELNDILERKEVSYVDAIYKPMAHVKGLSGMIFNGIGEQSNIYMISDHEEGNTLSVGTINSSEKRDVKLEVAEGKYQDWEDIELEKCHNDIGNCVYIANLGDNGTSRSNGGDDKQYNLFYFKETELQRSSNIEPKSIKISYEDGSSQNSEAMSILDGEIYVTTKRSDPYKNTVWKAPIGDEIVLKKLCYLDVEKESGWSDVTASDFFEYKSETYFAYRDYTYIYLYKGIPNNTFKK